MTAQLNLKNTARLLVGGLLSLYLTPIANAQGNGHGWKPNPAFQTCEQSAGVTAGQRPTQAQWNEIRTCMKTAWQTAETQCAQQSNVTVPAPGSGQHLDKADWRKMHACMKTAGFGRWPNNHGGQHEHGHWQQGQLQQGQWQQGQWQQGQWQQGQLQQGQWQQGQWQHGQWQHGQWQQGAQTAPASVQQ